MMSNMHPPSIFLFILITILTICYLCKCEARDSIGAKNPLSDDGGTLVSAGNRFELGFFTPEGNENSNRYVGIWYYMKEPRTTVWVANRGEPLPGSCGLFGIAEEDGNINLRCGDGVPVWATKLEITKASNRTLQLLDSGNLVLVDGQSGSRVWQSFDNPTDTFLPGMQLKDDSVILISWISPSDPGAGDYTFRQDQGGFSILNRSTLYWKKSGVSGPSIIKDKLPSFVSQLLLDSATEDDQKSQLFVKGNNPISYSKSNYTKNSDSSGSRLVMSSSGMIQVYDKNWRLSWREPENKCRVHDFCGNSAICNYMKTEPKCDCPKGFKPVSSEDWKAGQYSDCCDRGSKTCNDKDSFLKLNLAEVPGEATPFDQAQTEEECKGECLSKCKCKAYYYSYIEDSNLTASVRDTGKSAPKCWIWADGLVSLYEDYNGGILNISLRVPSPSVAMLNPGPGEDSEPPKNPGEDSEPPKNMSRKRYVIFIIVIVGGVGVVTFLSYILYRRVEQSGNQEGAPALFSNESERRVNKLMHENDMHIDVPFYNVDAILSATDNFSDANKLGQGGFGPVYKGKFPGGQEFAVKRLSSCSGQGIEEFLNEVVLIAKLQHRNLVRLLGYCIKGNEKILLYEYMPNRSLDGFIFTTSSLHLDDFLPSHSLLDQNKCLLLDWKKRVDIILGIARGLLYLHQDSRLRIIHRDLKTSNILLDEDMNPKISDFGLARIVEGKGTEASTNKVVGTYGYMSPEYALDGKFSTKSDVFSFGVVILEIISGKKTTGFYNPHQVMNLLGYTWRLWSEDKALNLIDPTLLESCDKSQVMKCINIGLLCVQEDPNERPSMSTVVIMLGSETGPLPLPSQPAFVVRRRLSAASSSSSTKPETISKNELTISIEQGR
ncbi:hypothetical protein ACS0TY_017564 [Phlomoides rotata]